MHVSEALGDCPPNVTASLEDVQTTYDATKRSAELRPYLWVRHALGANIVDILLRLFWACVCLVLILNMRAERSVAKCNRQEISRQLAGSPWIGREKQLYSKLALNEEAWRTGLNSKLHLSGIGAMASERRIVYEMKELLWSGSVKHGDKEWQVYLFQSRLKEIPPRTYPIIVVISDFGDNPVAWRTACHDAFIVKTVTVSTTGDGELIIGYSTASDTTKRECRFVVSESADLIELHSS